MKKISLIFFLTLFFVSPLMAETLKVKSEQNEEQTSVKKEEVVEVVLISTQHFLSDMPPGFTPGHLRALLEKVAPDVVAVEAPVNVADPWSMAPMDLWQITRPCAEQQGVALVPVGWEEPLYSMQIQSMFNDFAAKDKTVEYQAIETAFQNASALEPSSYDGMNSQRNMELWRDYHSGLHRLYGKDTPWEDWNKKIMGNILKVCAQYKGKRVAIIFGGAHSYYFYDHLAHREGIRLLSLDKFFPLSAQAIERNTQPEDYLHALRLLNFGVGMLDSQTLSKLAVTLEKVKTFPEFQNDYDLFQGKFLMHSNKPKEAGEYFQKLNDLDDSVISLFDNQTPLNQAGLLNLALSKIQIGENASARENLKTLLAKNNLSSEMRAYALQLLGVLK